MSETLDFQVFTENHVVASVALSESSNWPGQDGYTADWWVSMQSGIVLDALLLIGHLNIPIYGTNLALASQRAANMSSEVIDFISKNAAGAGSPSGTPDDIQHVWAHLRAHEDNMSLSEFEKTVAYYGLLSEFKVANPAVMIALHMGVKSVRTVHDRIARARRNGLLQPLGRGRSHI